MAGLKLKLRPEEQILINGAVVQNGRHQVELTVKTPNTRILRLRDAIHPNDANTPVKRVCYVAQMAVAGEVTDAEAHAEFTKGVQALLGVFQDEGSQDVMQKALQEAEKFNFYKAMQFMRKLISYEEALMMKYDAVREIDPEALKTSLENAVTLKELHDELLTKYYDDRGAPLKQQKEA
ncbi:MAG: flagellar biosynthesis repressor FlbT [Pseudomonadota bacterium]